MVTVMFYHLTRSPATDALAAILPRAVGAGWRVLVRAEANVLAELDQKLWAGPAESFIPHALAGAAQDDDQPVLLGNLPSNGFDALALIGTVTLDVAEAVPLQRVWVLFDASDEDQMNGARTLWRTISDAGQHAQYWSEETGSWAMKTSANAPAKA